MLGNVHQTQNEVLRRILSALQEVLNETTGKEIPFTADTLYGDYCKFTKCWDYVDLAEFRFDIEAYLGVDVLPDDWDRLFGLSIHDDEEWQERIGSKLTFRDIAVFIRDRTRIISIEPATILGKPCRPAGAFRTIVGVVSELLPLKEAFAPSAKIDETFTAEDLSTIWYKLRWLSENRLPPLRNSPMGNIVDKVSLVVHGPGLFFSGMGAFVGLVAWAKAIFDPGATLPAWPLLAISTFALLIASSRWQIRYRRAPKHIQTIADLARAMVVEPKQMPRVNS